MVAVSAAATAQSHRTFVSGTGTDTGACPVTAPCRSFAYAVTQTASGGDVAVLGAAGYGPVTITQPVNIVSDGNGEAAITVSGSGQNAISINLASGGAVTLRGLTLAGLNGAHAGIEVAAVGTLSVQNCTIGGFGFGIQFQPTNTATLYVNDSVITGTIVSGNPTGIGIQFMPNSNANLYVSDTIASDNTIGFQVDPTGGQTLEFFEHAQALNGNTGFVFGGYTGNIVATIADSAAVGNVGQGFQLFTGTVAITHTTESGSEIGLYNSGGTVFLSGSMLNDNSQSDFGTEYGTITSYGNNTLTGPAGNNVGTLTPASQQ